jgi:transposase
MESDVRVTVGVDTHADAHVGLALAQLGRRLGEEIVQNDESGYRRLLRWARGLGNLGLIRLGGSPSFSVQLDHAKRRS